MALGIGRGEFGRAGKARKAGGAEHEHGKQRPQAVQGSGRGSLGGCGLEGHVKSGFCDGFVAV